MDGKYLVHIPFTNTSRLVKPTHLFSYKGQAFKITRTRKSGYADNLLTIVENEKDIAHAAKTAAEFFSALAWETQGNIHFGNPTWARNGRIRDLKSAQACIFDFARIPPGREIGGYSISHIPHIENETQRLALALYREAGAANNDYLQFLFYWQILSLGTARKPREAANKALKDIKDKTWIGRLELNGKTIGDYFRDDCRDAIAHVTRNPGETTIDFDDPADRKRISLSVKAVKTFAHHDIKERLALKKTLHLFKEKPGSIPAYMPADQAKGKYVVPDQPNFRLQKK